MHSETSIQIEGDYPRHDTHKKRNNCFTPASIKYQRYSLIKQQHTRKRHENRKAQHPFSPLLHDSYFQRSYQEHYKGRSPKAPPGVLEELR